jgi:hypothetical protein
MLQREEENGKAVLIMPGEHLGCERVEGGSLALHLLFVAAAGRER